MRVRDSQIEKRLREESSAEISRLNAENAIMKRICRQLRTERDAERETREKQAREIENMRTDHARAVVSLITSEKKLSRMTRSQLIARRNAVDAELEKWGECGICFEEKNSMRAPCDIWKCKCTSSRICETCVSRLAQDKCPFCRSPRPI